MYAVTGYFPILSDVDLKPFHPARMEIELISTNATIEGAVSYVSDDCLGDYGIDPYNYNAVLGSVDGIFAYGRKKRAVVQTNITPKCFNWKDVLQLFGGYLKTITTCMTHYHNLIYRTLFLLLEC